MKWFLRRVALLRVTTSRDGVTAIEYGLIAALIAVVIIAAVTTVGTNMSTMYNYVASVLHS